MPARRVARLAAAGVAVLLVFPVLAGCASRTVQPAPAAAAEAPSSPAVPENPLNRQQMTEVQSMLAKRGYEPGPIDGRMGPRTARAIARYQRDSGLEVNGVATMALIRHMQGQPETAPQVVAVEAAIPSGLYPVGTRFVYSGVEVHSVDRVEGGRVSWETSIGDHYVTGPHFGLPDLEWQSGSWRGVAESTLPPETSWPPNQGVDLYFDVTSEEWNEAEGRKAQRHVSDASWSCSNKGAKAVKVPAGSFKAQAILCERSPAPAGAWQRRVWYYVPAVGHFVRRVDFDGAGLEIGQMDLVAILPGGGGATLRKGREGAIHDALDRAPVGRETIWRNPAGTERYVIRVDSRFNGPGGKPCRTYSIVQQDSLPRREYPAVACRGDGKQRWVIPGLD